MFLPLGNLQSDQFSSDRPENLVTSSQEEIEGTGEDRHPNRFLVGTSKCGGITEGLLPSPGRSH